MQIETRILIWKIYKNKNRKLVNQSKYTKIIIKVKYNYKLFNIYSILI